MPLLKSTRAVLQWLHRLARRLQVWRPLFFVFLAVFTAMVVYGLSQNESVVSPWLQLGLSGLLWSLMLLATVELFQRLPPSLASRRGFFSRLKLRLHWLFYGLLALIIILSSLFLLTTSMKLLRV